MTAEAFVAKWSKVDLTERSAAQAHFLDLCELVGHPKPQDADPKGEWFTFERGASKQSGGDGWADVWKKDFFGWEYKGRHKDLGAAYDQLLEYRADLNNPPLLVVCDMDIIRVHTNFNNAPTRTHEISLTTLGQPRSLEILNAVFHAPDKLRPGVTSEAITEKASGHFAEIAESMRKRGLDPQAVAHFLVRVVFCLFAEDVGLLERGLFTRLVTRVGGDPNRFARHVGDLFSAMATGGEFLLEPIRHFNGSLFDATPVLELTAKEIAAIGTAAGEDWSAVDVSISGTLFERGLNPAKRSQLGSHYTSRPDIETIVEPVVLAPLRRDWAAVRAKAEPLLAVTRKLSRLQGEKLVVAFLEHLKAVRVLDPAGGSGNFLFVTLQKLLELEREVNHFLRDQGFTPQFPQVNPLQLHCLEIDPYAHDLAQTVVWIGYIQWLRANGYGFPAEPILKRMSTNFRCADALFTDWPEVDFIVSNPPFLGGSKIWEELGREYQQELWRAYEGRVPGFADLCCYWFEKAREHIAKGKCSRVGLLATQGIRGGANREVLKRIKETGDIFFAQSDRDWILAGANVHVSMVGFDDGKEECRTLDGQPVPAINANLTSLADTTQAKQLQSNLDIAFIGTKKAGDFNVEESRAVEWLPVPNPHGRPNSDILKPWLNGSAIVKRAPTQWIVDCGTVMTLNDFIRYAEPYRHVLALVKPERDKNNRALYRKKWWLHAETRPGMREAISTSQRYVATPRVSKYRVFVWVPQVVLCDDGVFVFARADDYFFGVVHSRAHEVWARVQGTQVRERESGFRYTPTTCFETFPFPFPDESTPKLPPEPPPPVPNPVEAEMLAAKYYSAKETPPPYQSASATPEEHRAIIAQAAKELSELRERWLNPPEWTETRTLEFPGSSSGPWARYVDLNTVDGQSGIGTVRYPRLEPRDADCAAKLKKRTLTNLYNERPAWLDLAHQKLDAAVAAAYGWPADLTDEQILERLLALNLERAEEEAKAVKVT
jgi:type II restriction/modification system DNA methylase subunit YeeA